MGMFGRRRRRRQTARGTHAYKKHKETARMVITAKIKRYNELFQYRLGRVSIRNQRTRWGSCSKRGNLNFNYKILFLEESFADYIVVHELCHLQELNHSKRFWSLVAQVFPNYRQIRNELRRKVINNS